MGITLEYKQSNLLMKTFCWSAFRVGGWKPSASEGGSITSRIWNTVRVLVQAPSVLLTPDAHSETLDLWLNLICYGCPARSCGFQHCPTYFGAPGTFRCCTAAEDLLQRPAPLFSESPTPWRVNSLSGPDPRDTQQWFCQGEARFWRRAAAVQDRGTSGWKASGDWGHPWGHRWACFLF